MTRHVTIATTFVRLRWRLLRASLRGRGSEQAGVVVSTILSAVVGAGLVFAGVTDTCGMGMVLARMPWNRVPEPAACAVR